MSNITDFTYSQQALKTLAAGAFLTAGTLEKSNTMTIGWGSIGFMWRKPVFTVMVRPSRFTYQFIEQAGEFTVSIPASNMQQAIAICGSISGRDKDKLSVAGLKQQASKMVKTPVIAGCDLYYECKVLYKQAMIPSATPEEITSACYADGDFHVFYFGEIVAAYTK